MNIKHLLLLIWCLILLLSLKGNKLDDGTAYEFPLLTLFPPMPASDNMPSKTGAELGRYLFYDTLLSSNYQFSCATCHRQEVAFSDAPNRFSLGITGEPLPRNTMPLFNLAWYDALFWDGKAATIEQQVLHPVRAEEEMNLSWKEATARVRSSRFYREKFGEAFGPAPIDSSLIAKAIAQFLRTLVSQDSKYDRVLRREAIFTEQEYEGFLLVNDQSMGNCLQCHTTDSNALGTTGEFSNNGLQAVYAPEQYSDKGLGSITGLKQDLGKFKIPSLRNVALTAPYMHDGRFSTLEAVVDFYSEGLHNSYNVDSKLSSARTGGLCLEPEQKLQILAFLHTLTDSTFISKSSFSNPHLIAR